MHEVGTKLYSKLYGDGKIILIEQDSKLEKIRNVYVCEFIGIKKPFIVKYDESSIENLIENKEIRDKELSSLFQTKPKVDNFIQKSIDDYEENMHHSIFDRIMQSERLHSIIIDGNKVICKFRNLDNNNRDLSILH